MKKYLMTGMAAVLFCGAFTSCSHDDITSAEDISKAQAEQITKTYETAFLKYVGGEIDKNQTWGFGSVANARTRANYANANQWGAPADPNNPQTGWKVPSKLSEGQKLRVTRYFQNNPNPDYEDPHWTAFFVQQVYTGGTNVSGQTDESYKSAAKKANENDDITSGTVMNYLNALNSEGGWDMDHINNFNGGTAGEKDVLRTGSDINSNDTYKDQINLMVESTTRDFSYQNATGSLFHNRPYVALVSAQTIDDWAKLPANYVDGKPIGEDVVDDWDRSFMGCDYELLIGEAIYDGGYMKLTDASSLGAAGRFVDGEYVAGIPTDEYKYNNQSVRYLKAEQNMYGGDFIEIDDSELCYDYRRKWTDEGGNHDEYVGKVLNTTKFDQLLKDGYLPVASSNLKKWVKPQEIADGYYSDWIVTLTKAERQGTTPTPPTPTGADLRIMAEDLSASDDTDFDFNDIVFDVYFDKNNTGQTKIVVQAAGGTLPLRIWTNKEGDPYQEVHALWSGIEGISTGTMINTGAEAMYGFPRGADNRGTREVTLYYSVNSNEAAKGIKIEVQKTTAAGLTWVEMKAEQGEPAAKFAVPATYEWLPERSSIKDEKETFVQWCQNHNTQLKWW